MGTLGPAELIDVWDLATTPLGTNVQITAWQIAPDRATRKLIHYPIFHVNGLMVIPVASLG